MSKKEKLLIITAHKFHKGDDGLIYSAGQYTPIVWERYLKHFKELIIVGQLDVNTDSELIKKLTLSSHSNVSFILDNAQNRSLKKKYKEIRRILKHIAYADFIMIRSYFSVLLWSFIIKLKRKPYLLEIVACPWDSLYYSGSFKKKLLAPIAVILTKIATKIANNISYVTNKFLQRRYPPSKHARVLSCSNVEIKFMEESTLNSRKKKILSTQMKDVIVFGLIGSLSTRYKGVQTVFEAISILNKQEETNIQFKILGPGNTMPWMQEAKKMNVSNFIQFDGTLPSGQKVYDWLDEVDIYLQPSFQEGLPRALIEAMSRGLPAIGSSCGGIPELLCKECIIEPGDSHALANLMLKLASSKDTQLILSNHNWHIAKSFKKDILDKRREDFLTTVIKCDL